METSDKFVLRDDSPEFADRMRCASRDIFISCSMPEDPDSTPENDSLMAFVATIVLFERVYKEKYHLIYDALSSDTKEDLDRMRKQWEGGRYFEQYINFVIDIYKLNDRGETVVIRNQVPFLTEPPE